jgi:TRAP-type C4-dicarboxylate transport system permease small subunit
MDSTRRILAALRQLEEWLLVVAFSVMGIALLSQVFFRYILNAPLVWSEELARYLLVWVTFLGINYGIRLRAHIEMEYFFTKFPRSLQRVIPIVTQVFTVACLLLFLPGAIRFVSAQGGIDSSAMQINMGLVYAVIPIGMVITAASLSTDTVRRVIVLATGQEGDR